MKEGISKFDMSLPLRQFLQSMKQPQVIRDLNQVFFNLFFPYRVTPYSRFSPLVAQFHEAIKFK